MDRHNHVRLIKIGVLLGLFCGIAAGPTLAATTALRVGHLIDPATAAVAANQIVLIKDGKIAEVGPSVEIPDGARVIDLTKAWVMPGLMDAHTHITMGNLDLNAGIEAVYLKQSSAARALLGLRNAQDVLRRDSPPSGTSAMRPTSPRWTFAMPSIGVCSTGRPS